MKTVSLVDAFKDLADELQHLGDDAQVDLERAVSQLLPNPWRIRALQERRDTYYAAARLVRERGAA